MATSLTNRSATGLAQFWPWVASGLVAPIAATALARWIAPHVAVGGSYFVVFVLSDWLFQRTTCPEQGMRRRTGTIIVFGLAGGLAAGLVTFLFPWT
jgi:hypothetical protein